MVKLAQSVLLAVSAHPELFKKEYFKFMRWMPASEVEGFSRWCMLTFDVELLRLIGMM